MKDKSPKCDCGKDLLVMYEVIYTQQRKINKNGKPSKKYDTLMETEYGSPSWLQCVDPDCNKEYEYWDENEVIIRGEERL